MQRAVIQNFNLAMLVVAFSLHLGSGFVAWQSVPLLAIVAASVLVPVLLGARLYIGISETAFRRIVLGLLTLVGRGAAGVFAAGAAGARGLSRGQRHPRGSKIRTSAPSACSSRAPS